MDRHNPHGQSQDKDRHDKQRHDKNNKDEDSVEYTGQDPADPTGSKEEISTPKKNSGYDEKQPKHKQ